MLKYSLILATIGRSIEVERFLASLDRQTYRSFELIVVDQNDDDRVSSMLESYRDNFEIIYLKSKPGLSIARNRGLQEVSGDIVAFPDDDCWYPPNLLEAITQIFSRYDIDIVTGQSRDEENRHSQRFWSSKPSVADVISVWKLAISYTVFI
ncbi:glycosyltransferase family 2 protein, partial [Litorivivens sp.]|uniref:glycosyltransferase family 2 protein n=1 Tax=Litorivivens sp. TaxID=2020868 RepID=UPI00356166AA